MRNSSAGLFAFDLSGTRAMAQAVVVAAFLCLAVCLGGASAAGPMPNAVLQVAGMIAITAVLLRRWPTPLTKAERHLLTLALLFVVLYLAQLIPLPPVMWRRLPGRDVIVSGFDVLGIAEPWLPISLTPGRTLHSGVALLAPIAMILMIVRFQRPVARVAIVAVLGLMIISVLLGVAQFSGNGAYLYAVSNFGSATGFFPNANHFGTLMCVSIPLAAGLVTRVDGHAVVSRAIAIAIVLAIVLVALLGVAMTKSVAGVLLAMVAIIGSTAILLPGLSNGLRFGFFGGVVLILIIAGAVVFTVAPDDFVLAGLNDQMFSRPMMWRVTAHAIGVFGVFGTGLGSFQPVFHLFENPEYVTNVFANHAHNDLLEFLLEGGIPGLALLVAFLAWFFQRLARIWLFDRRRDPLAQAAAIAATILLLHSLVDYPLRTGAMATIFGLCIALMARGSGITTEDELSSAATPVRHLSA